MATKNKFTWTSRDAKRLMNSKPVNRVVRLAAQRGLAAFKQAAPRATGSFASNVRIQEARGWDGREGYAIVAFPTAENDPIAIEYGTSDTPAANALQAARDAIEGQG